ncbi:MAG TPA: zinc ribbon domain-containing protein [Phycisphaerae bacterium]|jgi:putative FmdB family regulatory protein|nr:zinc ribbon domain-containing protein [Phycisphaerae bacterium]HOB74560.1 zinc ribbon domain-containing protein [Phycisphaerae bacterium]HOJ54170.1 zinc ribbon domain-containing protein [Phycisphaerae bacterium]HOL26639.1 zinc ribbon domain-containing protein [Phycisphaerae bacterium]HPP20373.1 zinc ribbon domain-containing protein [Phycisphaerae bacterium]
MPIYEYQCSACDHAFEELVQSAEAEAAVVCPHCKSGKVQKRLSVFAAHQASLKPGPPPPALPSACCKCSQAGACGMQPPL